MAKSNFSEGFTGMGDLIRDLERMGEDVQSQAAVIVRGTAELMAANLSPRYPSVSGTLRDRVVVEKSKGGPKDKTPLRWKVRNKAPHAHLYEFGTVQRFTASRGANRGSMPAKPTFIPAAVRARAGMVRQLTSLVQSVRVKGMTGSPGVRER